MIALYKTTMQKILMEYSSHTPLEHNCFTPNFLYGLFPELILVGKSEMEPLLSLKMAGLKREKRLHHQYHT